MKKWTISDQMSRIKGEFDLYNESGDLICTVTDETEASLIAQVPEMLREIVAIKLAYQIALNKNETMYTREEVMKIVRNCANYFFSQGIIEGTTYSRGGDNDYVKWFDKNVTKSI